MNIIIAPDKFKASADALTVARAIETGLRRVLPDANIDLIPLADGGDGTAHALIASMNGKRITTTVTGPLAENVTAHYGLFPHPEKPNTTVAIIEMATAAGLALIPKEKQNPLHTTTYGVGQLIRHALDNNATELILAIGGSATNDGGAGLAQSLGARFYDQSNTEITTPLTGSHLNKISRIDLTNLDPRIPQTKITVACDVTNPLLGPGGAAHTYAPQKGATPDIVDSLESAMAHFYDLVESQTQKSVRTIPGSGAAGGLGAAGLAFLNATLTPGIDLVIEYTNFKSRITHADLIITGEGQIDHTTLAGKTISGILAAAAPQHIPTIILAGTVHPSAHQLTDPSLFNGQNPLKAILPIAPGPITLEEAMTNVQPLLTTAAQTALQLITTGQSIK